LTKELNLEDTVVFCGRLSEKEKIGLLKESKLYVLCSKLHNGMSEGFGITFVEAQAAGLPVVASKTGGIPEAVGNGGVYVDDPNNPSEIADKISKVLTDPKLYLEIKSNLNGNVNKFDVKSWIDNNISVYKAILIRK
jgi:glycosyltransferase involved in cell wall biosynthesis